MAASTIESVWRGRAFSERENCHCIQEGVQSPRGEKGMMVLLAFHRKTKLSFLKITLYARALPMCSPYLLNEDIEMLNGKESAACKVMTLGTGKD